jgi:FkbM family methyltransferase
MINRCKSFAARTVGVLALTAHRLLRRRSISIRGGEAAGLKLATAALPLRHVHGYHLFRGSVEPSVQAALREYITPGAVVFDIGANVGFFSLLSARLAGPGGRVEAFEPVPASAAAIAANAAANDFGTITVNEVAVTDHQGPAELLIVGDHSWSHLAERGWHPKTSATRQVQCVVLDDRIDAGVLPAPDVIKIDIEGSEVAALRGLSRTLRSRNVVVICELHDTNREVLALLSELGYSVINIDGDTSIESAGPVHVVARQQQ